MEYSTGGQELLVGLASEEIGGRDGPRITSACHCSSRVCEPGERRCNSRKMSPLLRSGLAISQDRICSHSPSKGPCGCASSLAPVFSAPALGTRSGALQPHRVYSPRRKVSP